MSSVILDRYANAKARVLRRVENLGPSAVVNVFESKEDAGVSTYSAKEQETLDNRRRTLPALHESGLDGYYRARDGSSRDGKSASQAAAAQLQGSEQKKSDEYHEDHYNRGILNVQANQLQERELEQMRELEYSGFTTVWRPAGRLLSDQEQMDAEFKWYARYYSLQQNFAVEADVNKAGWIPEEEGFYQPPKTFKKDKNAAIIEARLLREDPTRSIFFDSSGTLINERNPLREGLFHPSVFSAEHHSEDTALRTNIEKPVKYTGNDKYYEFRVVLYKSTLQDHPLFTFEDFACRRLEEDYAEYQRRMTVNLVHFYDDQIEVFRTKVKGLERRIRHMNAEDVELRGLLEELQSTLVKLLRVRKLRDNEELETLQLFKHMYTMWRNVQEWRKRKTDYMQAGGYLTRFPGQRQGAHEFDDDSEEGQEEQDYDDEEEGEGKYDSGVRQPYAAPPSPPRPADSDNDDGGDGDIFSSHFNNKPTSSSAADSKRPVSSSSNNGSSDVFGTARDASSEGKASIASRPRDPRPTAPGSRVPRVRSTSQRSQPSAASSSSSALPALRGAHSSSANDAKGGGGDVFSSQSPAPPDSARSTGSHRPETPHGTPPQTPPHSEPVTPRPAAASQSRSAPPVDARRGNAQAGNNEHVYVGYPLMLRVRKESAPASREEELRRWEATADLELSERKRLHEVGLILAHPENRPDQEELRRWQEDRLSVERANIASRMKRSRRHPGKPTFHPVLDKTGARVTPTELCDPVEIQRRKDIREYSVQFELKINEKPILRTENCRINFPEWSIAISQSVNVQLLSVPQTISVNVFHKRTLVRDKLGEIFVGIPELNAGQHSNTYDYVGIPIPDLGHTGFELAADGHNRFVRGNLQCAAFWIHDDKSEIVDAHSEFHKSWNRRIMQQQRNGNGRVTSKRLLQVYQNQAKTVDPNDPKNAAMLEILRREQLAHNLTRTVRTEEVKRELFLVDQRYYRQSARKRILFSRKVNPVATSGRVPLDDRAVRAESYAPLAMLDRVGDVDKLYLPASDFDFYSQDSHSFSKQKQARAPKPSYEYDPLDDLDSSSFESRARRRVAAMDTKSGTEQGERAWRQQQLLEEAKLDRILKQETKLDAKTHHEKERESQKLMRVRQEIYDTGEVVKEEALPTPKFLIFMYIDWFSELFRPRARKMHVERKAQKLMAQPKSCKLRLQIIRAQNMPERVFADGFRESSRVFVEVSFQSHRPVATSVQAGVNPSWNEMLSMPFLSHGASLSPAYLKSVKDDVHFNFFDELLDDEARSGRQVTTTTRNVRWLGSISIPFTTIYLNTMVEGRFQVNVPFFLLGYETPYPNQQTSVWLYATLDPQLVQPPEIRAQYESHSKLAIYASGWREDVKAKPACSKRYIEAVAGDINGNPQLICNYITPQPPFQGLEEPDVFTRFVSQIPFLEDFHANSAAGDIWCSSKEFLALTYGDWEEHAILLCNYFTHSDGVSGKWRTFVLLGHAIPEGRTAYVVRLCVDDTRDGYAATADKKVTSKILFNPVTGQSWDLGLKSVDVDLIPLQSVGCVFNQKNVWANIQTQDHPADLNWNLDNKKMWKPLFNTKSDKKHATSDVTETLLESIQQPVRYYASDPQYFIDRAFAIERLVEQEFGKWRSAKPVGMSISWDYGVCSVLREILATFEFVKQKMSQEPDATLLEPLLKAYDGLYGFPLAFSECDDPLMLSTNMENPILYALRNTRLHQWKQSNVQFALAVHIHRYPNNIGTIWIMVAALSTGSQLR